MSTTLTIRNLEERVKQKLRVQAASNGRSMEAEARAILTLNGKMRTTDYTDLTDLEYLMSPGPLTQRVNGLTAISNPTLSVKSV